MVFDIFTLVEGLWIFLPAYAANGLAPLVKFKKGLHPIDSNKSFRGKPIFGPGKDRVQGRDKNSKRGLLSGWRSKS